MKKRLCGGLILSLLSISSGAAYITDTPPIVWKGPYGGIVLSYEWVTLKDAAEQLPTKANPKGFGYGLNLGVGTSFKRAIYLGADFDFIISNASWSATPVSGTNVYAKARQRFTFQLTGQLGIPLNAYMIYGGIGGGWSKYSGSIFINSNNNIDLKGNTSGLAWNVGLKHQIQGIMFDFRFTDQPSSYTIKAGSKIKVHAYGARLGILYVGNF